VYFAGLINSIVLFKDTQALSTCAAENSNKNEAEY
jgi:hypothetical protein